ncbi:MAG: glutamate 5-kinase [Acidimicrobiia bacterium]|nr:glutamate 5-kinase [Acidimicrobiia bacterium]MYC58122.1 glutamate 5-kinase [Acidimicrobiia bacterium]MYG94388.1 glutamate 5-kinase [Acidimicrobiia bacterium]MYI30554.1 glutamate 5-kinase [Acidimicrobiia bacterium]
MTVVVKIGTSSITEADGTIKSEAIHKLTSEIAAVIATGQQVVVVSSGAIGAGLPVLGFEQGWPKDSVTLQALSAVGQSRLMALYQRNLDSFGLICGQVLLVPRDFLERAQYLHAQHTLNKLLELGVVPIVNENDAVADDAIRWGDNDRIAALVAHMVRADLLLLLTDIAGVYEADPRSHPDVQIIPEINDMSLLDELVSKAGGAGSSRGSGGMASKLAAARIASWSGVRTVIASADRSQVLADAVAQACDVGTTVVPQPHRLSARKLWLGFAVPPSGIIWVDTGAQRAVVERGASLLSVGVTDHEGDFKAGDTVEVRGPDGETFARGPVEVSAAEIRSLVELHSSEQISSSSLEVIHRDFLAVLPQP